MPDFDVVVIGGGPGGYAAALKASERGARVALVEAEKLGGACVHHACIPTDILLSAAGTYVDARDLDAHGVIGLGETFSFGRAAARKDALVGLMAGNIATALRLRGVTVIAGRASFTAPGSIEVATGDGQQSLSAAAFIIATGTRWDLPVAGGFAPDRVVTVDGVQRLPAPPASALVLGGGPSGGAFGLEYAVLLAIAGSEVTFAAPGAFLPGLDPTIAEPAKGMVSAVGVRIVTGASAREARPGRALLTHAGGEDDVPADLVLAGDLRRPFFASLDLPRAGVAATDRIPVDRLCRTNVDRIYAVGDVTGGEMLSSVASHMGEVAAVNATGGEAATRLAAIPRLLHTVPEIGWVGMDEEAARARGYDVVAGVCDLAFNARAIALGAREGLVKIVAERELGEVLGVHAAGPGAGEIVAVAAVVMQAEIPVHDVAAMVQWHPSVAEGLVEAAKRALV